MAKEKGERNFFYSGLKSSPELARGAGIKKKQKGELLFRQQYQEKGGGGRGESNFFLLSLHHFLKGEEENKKKFFPSSPPSFLRSQWLGRQEKKVLKGAIRNHSH